MSLKFSVQASTAMVPFLVFGGGECYVVELFSERLHCYLLPLLCSDSWMSTLGQHL